MMHPEHYAGTYTSPSGQTVTFAAVNNGLLLQGSDGQSFPLFARGDGLFWTADPRFHTFGLQFGRDAGGNVVEVSSGPQWFTNQRYTGPRTFSYPAQWAAYSGEYEAVDANGYFWPMHVYELKGKLFADGSELVPIKGRLFHIGTHMWQPAWLRFGEPLEGKTQLVSLPGQTLYRTNPY